VVCPGYANTFQLTLCRISNPPLEPRDQICPRLAATRVATSHDFKRLSGIQ
jgi:hypothetical protein